MASITSIAAWTAALASSPLAAASRRRPSSKAAVALPLRPMVRRSRLPKKHATTWATVRVRVRVRGRVRVG